MCFAHYPDYDGTLLDGFLGVFDLEDAALGGAGGVLVCEVWRDHLAYKVTASLS